MVKDFNGETLTLVFRKEMFFKMLNSPNRLQNLEQVATAFAGRKIKITAVCDENLSETDFLEVSGEDKNFLENAKKIFQANEIIKVNESEDDLS